MLEKNNREHIKLLYEKFEKINSYIKSAIKKEDMETIQNIFDTKNELIKEIVSFEKIYHQEIKKDKELLNFKLKLIEEEKINIKLMENLKTKAMREIVNTSKTKKIYTAYEPSLSQTQSTIELTDDDEN